MKNIKLTFFFKKRIGYTCEFNDSIFVEIQNLSEVYIKSSYINTCVFIWEFILLTNSPAPAHHFFIMPQVNKKNNFFSIINTDPFVVYDLM